MSLSLSRPLQGTGMSHAQCLGGRLGRCPGAADLSSRQQLPHRWRAPVQRPARSQRSRQQVSAQQFDFSLPDTGLYMPPDPANRLSGRETDPEFGLTVKQMAALGLGSQHRPLIGSEPEPVRMLFSFSVDFEPQSLTVPLVWYSWNTSMLDATECSSLPARRQHLCMACCRPPSQQRHSTAATRRSVRRRAW